MTQQEFDNLPDGMRRAILIELASKYRDHFTTAMEKLALMPFPQEQRLEELEARVLALEERMDECETES